jgi:predicted dehydrogenase
VKILVVGLGSIGRRHIRNLKALDSSCEIIVWRQHSKTENLGDLAPLVHKVVFTLEDALKTKPEIALITNPSPFHIGTAIPLAENNIHLFIEKPISHSLKDVETLIQLCKHQQLVLMVGYHLRFYRPMQELQKALKSGVIGTPLSLRAEAGSFLPDWRPGGDYRREASARENLGGGVILELSHELDYAVWLLGKVQSVNALIAKVSNLEIDVEDLAEITLSFSNGATGQIHLNMFQPTITRSCRIAGSEGMLSWDWNSHAVELHTSSGKQKPIFPAQTIERDEIYRSELQHFFSAVNKQTEPIVNGEEALNVLKIALAAKQSSRERCTVPL